VLRRWRELVPAENLFIEAVSHRGAGEGPYSSVLAARMVGFAQQQRLAAVLTNAVRYADPADAPTVDVLDAARRLVPLDARHVDRVSGEGYLKSGPQMAQVAEEIARLAGLEGRNSLLAATESLADSCVVDVREDLGIGRGLEGARFPELAIVDSSGRPANVVLRERCESGLARRSVHGAPVRERLEAELGMISQLGYASYFLTVAHVVDLIRDMGVRCAARGSGAGSLVNYALGISGVEPVRHGLLMERFLSPLRGELPDIDVDVESARRTEVYEKVLARFGEERCVCVSMMETYRVRHAIRDVGAALGLPPGEVDELAKTFPHIRARDIRAALAELPELRTASKRPGGIDPHRYDLMLRLVERLDALPRHVALHPCGVLLSDATLLDRTPVEASFLGFPMSQFDKDDVEALGLLKLDILGVRMQSAMAHAISEVQRVDGESLDIDAVPLDDPATFELIRSTKTLGCFQIESPGQRELLGKFAPETFGDLVIDISLFRPGPVKSDMVTPFLRARQGWAPVTYPHPDLAEALAETYGVVVFHEQVLQIVSIFTGCSLGEADEVRRALGDRTAQPEVRAWFIPAALANGYESDVVERVWEVLEAFASFGFCKAHAAAFALPTYQSAWLKAHHPAAFLAGVLTHDPGMYPKRLILDDARQLGITVLPLDVNHSDATYRVEKGADGHYGIRLALADVKGISDAEVERVVAGRPYATLADLWHRAGVSRPVAERLVVTGAFDSLYGIGGASTWRTQRRRGHLTRRDLLLQVADLDRWTRSAGRTVRADGPAVQLPLDLGDAGIDATIASGLPEMTDAERTRAELEVLGLDASQHVLASYEPFFAALGITRSTDLLRRRSKAELLVAGVKVATQTPPVRSGRRVIFVTLDDATGPVDATFFEDVQGQYAATVFHSWLLVIRGELRRTGPRGVSLRATGAWELPALHAAWQAGGLGAVAEVMQPQQEQQAEPAREHRVLVHPSGFRQSPYADIRPAGADPKEAPRKLWHASPGSAGR
jgi:error-prone DNA polymerase